MKRYFGSFLRSVFVKIFGNVKEPTIYLEEATKIRRFKNNIFIMYRMNEADTIRAVGNPIGIRRNDNVVLLAKNRQLFYADALNAWLHSPDFYSRFAIPAYIQASPGIQTPPNFEEAILNQRHPDHNRYMEELSLRAFRLFTLEMCIRDDTIEVTFLRAPIELRILAYVHNMSIIPDNILNICIRKILYDNLLLGRPKHIWFIATCDLYLDRPTGSRGLFHNDSNYYGVDRVQGSENIEYLSLLLLLENNISLVRGTSITARLRENEHRDRVAISLPSMNGTNIIIHDNSFLHATPMPNPETVDRSEYLEQVSEGIRPATMRSTGTTTTAEVLHPIPRIGITPDIHRELARAKPRQFIRCHYILEPVMRYGVVPITVDAAFLRGIFNDANFDYELDLDNPADTIRIDNVGNREDLDTAIRQLALQGRTIGGKKTKKRNKKTKKRKTYRMRGGVDKDKPIIITSDKKDMYDVSKYNTGAELVIDMDNGLYIEINELKPVLNNKE